MQISARRAPALAAFLRDLIRTDPFGIAAVEIAGDGIACLLRGFDPLEGDAIRAAQIGDIERPGLTMHSGI